MPHVQCHICVLISVLDLLSLGYDVHVLADGVSSSNKEEIPFALDRMRQAGACVGTSESVAFQLQCMFASLIFVAQSINGRTTVDCAKPNFKIFAKAIKEEKENTRAVLQTMLPLKSAP